MLDWRASLRNSNASPETRAVVSAWAAGLETQEQLVARPGWRAHGEDARGSAVLEAPASRATWEALEGPRKGGGGLERPERPEWRLTSGEVLRVLLLRSRHGQRGEGMRRVRDVFGGAFKDYRLGFAREMDGDRGVGHQVAHPARLRRSAEAKRAVDPNAIDGPRMRPRVWTDSRYPVIRCGPNSLLDVAPGEKAVRSSRRAVLSGKADRTNGGRLASHSLVAVRRQEGTPARVIAMSRFYNLGPGEQPSPWPGKGVVCTYMLNPCMYIWLLNPRSPTRRLKPQEGDPR